LAKSRYNLKQQCLSFVNPIEPASQRWTLAACDRSSIVYVGRFDKHKGGDLVIDAFGELASINPDLKLTFVGPDAGIDGEKLADYARRALSPDALSRLTYLGPLPQSEVAVLRTKHFLTLCASRFEVFGYTVLEAMSLGCPIVASAVGGVPELIQSGDNGLLFDPQDHTQMVAGIQKLLDNPSLAEEMGEHARQSSVAFFNTERAAAYCAEIYKQEIKRFWLRRTKSRIMEY
jgi:glycosyltransferase involved in cell wall biosynthesis